MCHYPDDAPLILRQNSHFWGDQWNGEDLSIYSVDDKPVPNAGSFPEAQSRASLDVDSPSYSKAQSAETLSVDPANLRKSLSVDRMSSKSGNGDVRGLRAAEAFIRPTPIATHGDVTAYGFDLKNATFKLSLSAPSSTPDEAPTVVFLPAFHFPSQTVEISGGKWSIATEEHHGAEQQILKWWHAAGEQTMTVRGVVRKQGGPLSTEEDEGYLKQFQKQACVVM